MPELPEVETVARQLRKALCLKTIVRVEISDRKVVSPAVAKHMPARIVDVTRHGKSLVFTLNTGSFLLAHLRMTGHFHVVPKGSRGVEHQNYLSGVFYLDDGSFFTFNEIRRFGGIRLLSAAELKQELSRLGPEPLDRSFTFSVFDALLNRVPQSVIKTKLMDQAFIAGIGNIYAQEALYHAGIHPSKRISDITSSKRKQLHSCLREILQLAIKRNGTTIQNFSHLDGKGDFQNFLSVYQQDRCPQNHPIQRLNIGGRGTYYCPGCQI